MLDGTCAHCAKLTHFTARIAYVRDVYSRVQAEIDGQNIIAWPLTLEVAATCDNCKHFNCCVGKTFSSSPLGPGDIITGSTVLPLADRLENRKWSPPALLPVDVSFLPGGVSGFLQEAHDAMSIGAYRAVLLLVRSTIEATARDKGVVDGSLVQKINKLHEGGHLRTGTRDMAHALRILGNDMAHGEIDVVPVEEDAHDALTVARFVLDDVYVADARRADMMARRNS